MSTNYYLEKDCDLGCRHQIHVGKSVKKGNGNSHFIIFARPAQLGTLPVQAVANLYPMVWDAIKKGWKLVDDRDREVKPQELWAATFDLDDHPFC